MQDELVSGLSSVMGHIEAFKGHLIKGAGEMETQKGFWGSSIVIAAVLVAAGAVGAQQNRLIPVRRCSANFDTTACFRDIQKEYQVGSQVGYLGNLYKFCFNIDTINAGKRRPVRVILMIDQSSSMCTMDDKNDSTDQRIKAAHLFLDSLAANSPISEVGVVRFSHWYSSRGYGTQWLSAKSLTSTQNVSTLHKFIDSAACNSPTGYPLGKAAASSKIVRTDIGHALDRAIFLANANIPATHDRHIILLTDGEWDDSVDTGYDPLSILNRYSQVMALPFIHSIYLTKQGSGAADLSELELVSKTTNGKFFGNVTPEEIVKQFQDLLHSMIEIHAERLERISFRNLATNQRDSGLVIPVGAAEFRVTLPRAWKLETGLNQIVIEQHLSTRTGVVTMYDTLRITKLDRELTQTEIAGYTMTCVLDTLQMAMQNSAAEIRGRNPISVSASVPASAENTEAKLAMFTQDLSSVNMRAIVPFPANDPSRSFQLVYHLDGDLKEAAGRQDALGAPSFSSTRGAFGQCLESGTITLNVAASQLATDFTIEAWIKPGTASQSFPILSGPLSLLVTTSGALELTIGGKKITTNGKIDRGVWQHVAVARSAGSVNIYVNGLPAGTAQSTTAAIEGVLTIGSAAGGSIDELRVSNVASMRQLTNGVKTLDLPVLTDVTWYTPAESATAEATMAPGAWTGTPKTLSLRVSAPEKTDMLVNMMHAPTTDTRLTWSKMSDPMRFAPTDTIGPKVASAKFNPGPRPDNPSSQTFPDTLYVVYSEPVNCTELYAGSPLEVFQYTDADKSGNPLANATFKSTQCVAGFVSVDTILLPQGGARIQPDFDSIGFVAGKVSDTQGNKSESAVSPTVIRWGVDMTIPPVAHTNPVTIGPSATEPKHRIPEVFRADLRTLNGTPVPASELPVFGVAIIKKSIQPLSEGFISIYDAVGNAVLFRTPMFRKGTDSHLRFLWDGRNSSGRLVGSGTYLARIECRKTNGETDNSQLKIGVKRK